MKKNFITRSETELLKGIALIFMFIHHFFTYPSWYIESIRYPSLTNLAVIFRNPFNSVYIFAFITGYTYFYHKNKNIKYSIKKILEIMIPYWLVFIIFVTIAIYTNTYNFELKNFILELVALKRPIMCYCWYIYFYYISMLILPFIHKKLNNGLIKSIFNGIILPIVIFTSLKAYFIDNTFFSDILYNLIRFFPGITVGYIFAKYSLFYKIEEKLKSIKHKNIYLIIITSLSFILKYFLPYVFIGKICFIDNYIELIFHLDMVYTPIFIYGILKLSRLVPEKLLIPFQKIGKLSLIMWFAHCIFFNRTRDIFMPILFAPKNPLLVLLWGILLTYVFSKIIDFVVKPISKKIKALNW